LLKELKSSFERLNTLAEVLGKNKDEFRNFVLGFIEQQLIQNTNHELAKICDGRYGLTQKESTHGHDFFISDRWNGAMERKVTTLSGGETFLVSLAMALTLAEMTRGQVDIDCFFIDEGFGSLDADSIEDAFSALMSVRSRGKQIGIISHIRELTSRIPANINLNKSAEGQSKIEYLYN
uniref:SbcC/MukB-like Walker B domain-containing protein n=1 Tax=Halobacteriovorax sp. TaxID=2020862 RepID=UPI0035670079